MRKFQILTIGMVVLALVAFNGLSFAEDKTNESADKPGKVTAEAQAVADIALAGQLEEYGKRTDNPLALVVAAQIMKNTPTQEKKMSKETKGEGEAESGKKSGELMTADKLLADAKAMAESQNNEIVVALADKESKIVAQRGAIPAPILHVDRVRAGYTDSYSNVTFRGGEYAVVYIKGDGDCDLDCYIYDENDHLIVSDTDFSDECELEWNPRWTGPFTIKVENLGRVYADYIVISN